MGAFSVTTASDNIPLLCAIFNEFYIEDGYDSCNWGIEGETYVVNADGKREFTDLIVNDPYSLGTNIMMTYYFYTHFKKEQTSNLAKASQLSI